MNIDYTLLVALYRDTDTRYQFLEEAEDVADRETLVHIWYAIDTTILLSEEL